MADKNIKIYALDEYDEYVIIGGKKYLIIDKENYSILSHSRYMEVDNRIRDGFNNPVGGGKFPAKTISDFQYDENDEYFILDQKKYVIINMRNYYIVNKKKYRILDKAKGQFDNCLFRIKCYFCD